MMYNHDNPIHWQGSLFDFERKGFFFFGKGAALEQNLRRLFLFYGGGYALTRRIKDCQRYIA